MKIENLITVLSVARLKSFSEAAFELDYSQSSVSRQVKSVESELGVQLFNRSSTSMAVNLTVDGKRLIKPIQSIVDIYDELLLLAYVNNVAKVNFTLGLPQHIFPTSAQSTLQSYLYVNHPEIILKIENTGFMNMSERILSRSFDAYLAYRVYENKDLGDPLQRFAQIDSDNLSVVPIAKYNLHVCMNASHPLANRTSLTIMDLKDETFLCNPESIASQDDKPHRCFLKLCDEAGFKPKIMPIERSYKDTKLLLTQTGHGVFLSFTPYGLFADPRIRSIPIEQNLFHSQYFIAYDPSRNKERIVNIISDIFKRLIDTDGFLN